jgi:hypothetical protein
MVKNAAEDYERFRWEHERERYNTLLQELARQSSQPRSVSFDVNG